MARISSLLACWIAVAALAEPSGSAAKDNAAYVVHMEHPAYPFELRQSHVDGTGLFLLHVRSDGSVQSVDTVRSTGNSILDASAKAAFLRWRFRPGRSMSVKMAVTFSLKHGVYIFSKTADTPLARYQKQVRDVIGSKWYSDLYKMMDMFRLGTARLVFRVDRHGQVRDLKVIQNTNNEAFANYCIQSVREAKLPPMPEDLAATLPPEGLRADFPFTVFADVKSLVR